MKSNINESAVESISPRPYACLQVSFRSPVFKSSLEPSAQPEDIKNREREGKDEVRHRKRRTGNAPRNVVLDVLAAAEPPHAREVEPRGDDNELHQSPFRHRKRVLQLAYGLVRLAHHDEVTDTEFLRRPNVDVGLVQFPCNLEVTEDQHGCRVVPRQESLGQHQAPIPVLPRHGPNPPLGARTLGQRKQNKLLFQSTPPCLRVLATG